jgi:hypothetical protein
VAQGVVDFLEAVEVDQHDGAAGAGGRQRVAGPGPEGRAVRQAGEAVVHRLVRLPGGVAAQRP